MQNMKNVILSMKSKMDVILNKALDIALLVKKWPFLPLLRDWGTDRCLITARTYKIYSLNL